MTGHIRRRGERSWELKFDIGVDALTGKRLTKYHSFKGTKREAKAELVRLMETARQGTYVDPSKATLSDFLDRWERDWAEMNVSPKTAERYAELLRVHIRPHLGALPVQKLQAVHLAELYATLLREGQAGSKQALSPRTIGHVHRVMHKVLKVAVEWAVTHRNVASVARPPKVPNAEIEILSRTKPKRFYSSFVASRFTRLFCWRSQQACDVANCWLFAGATSISTARRCASNNLWKKPNPAFALRRRRPSTGAVPSP